MLLITVKVITIKVSKSLETFFIESVVWGITKQNLLALTKYH